MATYSEIKAQREATEQELASLKVREEQAKKAVIQGMTVAEVQHLADAGVMSKEDVSRLFGIKNESTEGTANTAAPGKKKKIARRMGGAIKGFFVKPSKKED